MCELVGLAALLGIAPRWPQIVAAFFHNRPERPGRLLRRLVDGDAKRLCLDLIFRSIGTPAGPG